MGFFNLKDVFKLAPERQIMHAKTFSDKIALLLMNNFWIKE